jgi:putative iron-only hydrogenase system regulator
MEKDKIIASALITIEKQSPSIKALNQILGDFSTEIIARQGLSLPHKSINIISLIIESEVNTINSLAGKVGKLSDVHIKLLIDNKLKI